MRPQTMLHPRLYAHPLPTGDINLKIQSSLPQLRRIRTFSLNSLQKTRSGWSPLVSMGFSRPRRHPMGPLVGVECSCLSPLVNVLSLGDTPSLSWNKRHLVLCKYGKTPLTSLLSTKITSSLRFNLINVSCVIMINFYTLRSNHRRINHTRVDE